MQVSNGETESETQGIGWDMSVPLTEVTLRTLKRHLPQGIKNCFPSFYLSGAATRLLKNFKT